MKGKATSFDVAELAAVSQATVSRALRNHAGVDPETRKRIVDAAKALDYRPDQRAVMLRRGSTKRIAVVILGAPDAEKIGPNPFYMALLAHVAAAAAAHKYEILVSFQSDSQSFNAEYRREGVADGVIVIGSSKNSEAWSYFADAHDRGERIVCWGSPADTIPTVRCDNAAGAELAVQHLLQRGRRRIAFLGPDWQRHRAYEDRRRGWERALREHDLPLIEAPSPMIAVREEEGFASVIDLLSGDANVDAIFAACDTLAIGASRALHHLGKRVPEDVAIVGFDGISSALYATPSLTTIEQDVEAAGSQLVDALLSMLQGGEWRAEHVPVRLVERESSASDVVRARERITARS